MATIYGAEVGISRGHMIGAIVGVMDKFAGMFGPSVMGLVIVVGAVLL